jgi:DNA repair protein RadC
MYVRELRVYYRTRHVPGRLPHSERFTTAHEAALAFMGLLHDEPVEVCGLFCLSTRHDVLAYHELSRGTIDATLVCPREVFKVALLANAGGVIVGHNHPSGDPTPSPNDVALTRGLISAAAIIGVELVDHIIVAGDRYVSFRQAGYT